jgi:hypothetical protein
MEWVYAVPALSRQFAVGRHAFGVRGKVIPCFNSGFSPSKAILRVPRRLTDPFHRAKGVRRQPEQMRSGLRLRCLLLAILLGLLLHPPKPRRTKGRDTLLASWWWYHGRHNIITRCSIYHPEASDIVIGEIVSKFTSNTR